MSESTQVTPETGLLRRVFLQGLGFGAGLVLARGLGFAGLAGRGIESLSFDEALSALAALLTSRQRELLVLPGDHPSRQVTNTVTVLARPHLGTLLTPWQRAVAARLCDTLLSPTGRAEFARTLAVEGRFDGCTLAIYGEPEAPGAQVALMGAHVFLRGGGAGTTTSPLGGPIAYGNQNGNLRWRVEGNSFAHHGEAANRLFTRLDSDQRRLSILPDPPHELLLQPQQAGASFPGVRLGSLSEEARQAASELLETIFSMVPERERKDVFSSIDVNGGLEALHFATYASRGFYEDMTVWGEVSEDERRRRGEPFWQVWRVEGPGTVIHFKGYPHVHAYLQVVRDPRRANLGEILGTMTELVEGDRMRGFLEAALRSATGESLAWHGPEVPGRFCPGEVTTGLAYTLDPYRNQLAVASIQGRAMGKRLRDRLDAFGAGIEDGRRYRVATTGYHAGRADQFGDPDDVEIQDLVLSEALIDHLRGPGRGVS